MACSGRSRIAFRKRWSTATYSRAAASNSVYTGTPSKRPGSRIRSVRSAVLLFFFHNVNGDFSGYLAVQPEWNLKVAESADRLVQQDLAAVDSVTLLFESLGDVLGGYRSKELIVLSGFLRDGDADVGHHFAEIGGVGNLFGFTPQMSLPFLFDDLLIGFGGRDGQPLRQQKISGVAGRHLYQLAARAQLFDVFSQNHIHDGNLLYSRCERNERDVACLLNGLGQAPLVRSAYAGDAARHDLAAFGDER